MTCSTVRYVVDAMLMLTHSPAGVMQWQQHHQPFSQAVVFPSIPTPSHKSCLATAAKDQIVNVISS